MAVTEEEFIPNIGAKPQVSITSDKFKQSFTVTPEVGGYIMYKITPSTGKVPKELSGLYTTMKQAVTAVKFYEAGMKPSKAVARDKKYEERH